MADGLAGGSAPLACVQALHQPLHLRQAVMHGPHNIFTLDFQVGICGQTQRSMQRWAVLTDVHPLTAQQRLDGPGHPRLLGQRQQVLQRIVVPTLLGKIESEPRHLTSKVLPTARVIPKQVFQVDMLKRLGVL